MRDCHFNPTGEPGEYTCLFCGFVARDVWLLPIHKNCAVRSDWALGDMAQLALAKVGITKERWHRWMVFIYLAKDEPVPSGCVPCSKRQEQLNRLGDWLLLKWWGLRGWLASWRCP